MPRGSIEFIRNRFKGKLIGAEIGVSQGTHARDILMTLDCKLFLIDIWESYYETFILNKEPHFSERFSSKQDVETKLKGFNVDIIKGDSIEVSTTFPNQFFDFVYIDANHSYESVKKDIVAWLPKVKRNGVLCGHDYSSQCEGVMKAVSELIPDVTVDEPDWYKVIDESIIDKFKSQT